MTAHDDITTLDRIAACLDGRTWDVDTLEAVISLVRRSGRLVRDPDSVPSTYRVSYEDSDLEPLDGEDDFYSDMDAARAAFTNAVLSRPDGVATVAIWTLGADDEWTLVGSCDLVKLARYAE